MCWARSLPRGGRCFPRAPSGGLERFRISGPAPFSTRKEDYQAFCQRRSRGTAERPSAPKQKAPQPPPKEAKRGKGPGDDQRKIISAWSDDNARKSAAGLPGPVALRAQLERVRQEQLRSEVGQAEPRDGGALELEGGTGVFPALDGLSTSTKFTSSCWSERCSSGRGGAKRRYYDTLDDFEQGEREGGPLVRPTRLEGEPLAEGSDQRQEQRKRRSQEGDRP